MLRSARSYSHTAWLCWAIVALALLASATQAQAAPFDAQANLAYQLAGEYWGVPAPPLCTSVDAHLEPTLERDGAPIGGYASMPSEPEACEIAMVADQPFATTCFVAAHEYGHLTGHGHDYAGDPAQVMIPGHSTTTPECLAWVRRLTLPESLERQSAWCARLVLREERQHRSGERVNLAHCRHRVARIRLQIAHWQPLAAGALG